MTVATPSAKTVSPQVGAVPEVDRVQQHVEVEERDQPDDDHEQLQADVGTTSSAMRFTREVEKPRMLRIAT